MGKTSAMLSLTLLLLALLSWPHFVLSASDIYYCASVNTGASNAASKRSSQLMCGGFLLTLVQTLALSNRMASARIIALENGPLEFSKASSAGVPTLPPIKRPPLTIRNATRAARAIQMTVAGMRPMDCLPIWRCLAKCRREQQLHPRQQVLQTKKPRSV